MARIQRPSALSRLAIYGATTTLLTIGIFVTAFSQHDYFYTACVQISQSNAAMLILANMGLLLTILLGKLLVRIFFGQLRAAEVEHLYEKGWLAVTETCLALAILRDEFDTAALTIFVFLLFCKVFHWMLSDRIDFMEQQTRLTALFLVRTISFSILLAAVDALMVMYAIANTKHYGATIMIVFGFEFALLLVHFKLICAKFALNAIELSRDGEWDEKQTYNFYVELFYDFSRLVVYVGFFCVVMLYYGPPIHILRDLYVAATSFISRCRDWVRYRKAMQNMHLRYPVVSQDELEAMSDATCIICREEMTGPSKEQADLWNEEREAGLVQNISGDTPKRLPCSHVFHFNCLRHWLERQQSCPTCRHTVLGNDAASTTTRQRQQQQQHQQQQQSQNNNGSASDANQDTSQSEAAPSTSNATDSSPSGSSKQNVHLKDITTAIGAKSLIPIFPPATVASSSSGTMPMPFIPSLSSFPSPDLTSISEEQLQRLDTDSRAAVAERIRILSALQIQLSHMVVALTQVQSVSANQDSRTATYPSEFTHHTQESNGTDACVPNTNADGGPSGSKGKEPEL